MTSTTNNNASGFSLIELIVVLLIAGILVSVAIPKYVDLTQKAKKAADDAYVDGLRTVTVLLFTSNMLANSNVNHTGAPPGGDGQACTNSWPLKSQVTNQMMQAYSSQYYTNFYYDATSGIWTPLL